MFFLNVGLTRCATSKLHSIIRDSGILSVPKDKKELNYFIQKRRRKVDPYLDHFSGVSAGCFESSPAYSHKGVDFYKAIAKDMKSTLGSDVYVVLLLRNLIERAFSHYWYSISHHHAMYGSLWRVKDKKNPDRFKRVFNDGFLEFVNKSDQDFLFPQVDKIIQSSIEEFGEDKVIVGLSDDTNEVANSLLGIASGSGERLASDGCKEGGKVNVSNLPVMEINRRASSSLVSVKGNEYILPPKSLLISDARGVDVLTSDVWGEEKLNKIFESQSSWTKSFDRSDIPGWARERILKIGSGLDSIPEKCFLKKGNVVKDISNVSGFLMNVGS